MKKLEKLKLIHLSENALDERQKNALKGGSCGCGCLGCTCSNWRGVGSMPIQQSNSDIGIGSTIGHSNMNSISVS